MTAKTTKAPGAGGGETTPAMDRHAQGKAARRVPSGRIERIQRVSALGAGLGTDLLGAAGNLALGRGTDAAAERFHRGAARTLRDSLGGMKGLPMKLGQMVSFLDDLLPPGHRHHYREALQELQTASRPLRWKEIEAVLRADLGARPADVFARFDREPIAAASIGQVYRAALPDGREVAVKVQYPGIADAIRSDLKNTELLRNALSIVLPAVDVERSLQDISARVLEECDYGCELCSQQEFHDIWRDDPDVWIPGAVEELCGDHVLVTEFVGGRSWHRMVEEADATERNRLAAVMYRFLFRSLYVAGLFNADPHPGNYLFPDDGRVAFIDFGCVQRYVPDIVRDLIRVRRLVMDGVRGEELQEELIEALQLPPDFDREERAFVEEYTLAAYAPVAEDRAFRFDREHSERLADLSLKGGFLEARKSIRKGIRESKLPGFVFLNRIQFGFTSVMVAMEAEANWFAMIQEIDDEAEGAGMSPRGTAAEDGDDAGGTELDGGVSTG